MPLPETGPTAPHRPLPPGPPPPIATAVFSPTPWCSGARAGVRERDGHTGAPSSPPGLGPVPGPCAHTWQSLSPLAPHGAAPLLLAAARCTARPGFLSLPAGILHSPPCALQSEPHPFPRRTPSLVALFQPHSTSIS